MGRAIGDRKYLFVVDHKRYCYLRSTWPLGVKRALSVSNEISREVIVIIPFEFFDLRRV
jgi:hypothetical protein